MSTEPAIGDVLLDRYELVDEIGRGGFGVVFRAKQLGMNRDVAIKLLHGSGDEDMRERFRREAMMARNLNHPHTIRQYDFGQTPDGVMYLVLEYLDGVNLVEAIRAEGALGDDRVRHIAEGVLKSLGEAHSQGIVHRDLKPANIMLCNIFGESDFPKVLDFGIAKTVHGNTDLTQAGVALGSPKYMAPEILQGMQPSPAADVYSLAITLSEAIIGGALVDTANSVEAAQLQLSPKPLPVPDSLLDSALYPWLSIALKKEPSERFSDAAEMLDYLHAPVATLAQRGADVSSDTALPTSQFAPAPNVDPLGETMTGALADFGAASMETLPQDGVDVSEIVGVGDASDFAKTEAFQAIVGPADETAEALSIDAFGDDDAPTEMLSLADFEQQMAEAPTAEATPALTPSVEASHTAHNPANAATQRNPAVDSAPQPRASANLQSSPPGGGLGMVPGIGQNAQPTPDDVDRTEFVDLNSLGPTVSADDSKAQKTLFIALGGVVFVGILAITGLGAFLYYLRGNPSDPPPSDSEAPATSTELSEKVEFQIFARPKVTSVIIDGQEKTKTPARIRFSKSELPKTVELKHPGYNSETFTLTADGQTLFDIELKSSVKMNDEGSSPNEEPKNVEDAVEGPKEPVKKKRPRKKRNDKPKKDENVVPIF